MLSFRNDTPLVVGNDVTLAFAANMPLASAECAITGSNQGSRDCECVYSIRLDCCSTIVLAFWQNYVVFV